MKQDQLPAMKNCNYYLEKETIEFKLNKRIFADMGCSSSSS